MSLLRASPALAALAFGVALGAQPHAAPTYTKDVAPILFRNCTGCHRPQGIGPMSLLTYRDAKKAAADIQDAVATAYMPPWHAEGPHGTFTNDRRLSSADRATIAQWIDAGAPEGDVRDLPAAPVHTDIWTQGTPDVVLTMPTAFEVPAKGTIDYQYFEIPTNFTEDKWIQSIEVRAGAREVVHHVLVYARAPAGPPPAPGTPRPPPLFSYREDHQEPRDPVREAKEPRRQNPGPLIAGVAPGSMGQVFPTGTALKVRAGSVLTLQMHYTAHGHAMKDQTRVAFIFAKEPPVDEIRASAFTNGAFVIPAGDANHEVPSEIGAREPLKIWGMFPHTHVRGKRWEYRVVYPDGRTELVLDVPKYDFNWQTYYMFAKPLALPAGAKIEARAWYDNSAANPSNPDPKTEVRWGDQTWEEMQFTAFLYTVDRLSRGGGTPR